MNEQNNQPCLPVTSNHRTTNHVYLSLQIIELNHKYHTFTIMDNNINMDSIITKSVNARSCLSILVTKIYIFCYRFIWFGLWCLTPLSIILQIYRAGQETGVSGENHRPCFVIQTIALRIKKITSDTSNKFNINQPYASKKN